PKMASSLRPLFKTSKTVVLSLALLLTIRDHVVAIDFVKGSSMAPALSPTAHETGERDAVIIKRWKPKDKLQRGDVITFWKPHKPGEISIKRVVALEGDLVWPRDRESGTKDGWGGWGVRGNFLGQEGVKGKDGEDGKGKKGCLEVPYGHVWVEGDNWRGSFDSNDFGPISRALVDGKAVGVVRGWRWMDVPGKKEEKGDTKVKEGRARLPEAFLE
ncbi:LexA/Signal peptidase, partial [Delitschia confertaspora ATCC 74209]